MTQEYRQPVYAPPAGAADLLLVRHGESEAARPGEGFATKDGHGDPALHPQGKRQAERVGTRLMTHPVAQIYVTKLRRTHETAAPLAAHLGLSPREDPDLHEVHQGDWDGGLYRIKAAQKDPVYQQVMATEDWGVIPNAEPQDAFFARVRRGLERIATAHRDQQVAVFVHGGVISAALSIATGATPFAFLGAANGSISRLVITPDRMVLRGFNDVSHLAGL